MGTAIVTKDMPRIRINGEDLYGAYGLIPKERPIIQPPKKITNVINVPGSITGPIDMTYSLTPFSQYEDVSGVLDFYVDLSVHDFTLTELYSELMLLSNSSSMVKIDDDGWYFIGDVSFSSITSSNDGKLPSVQLSYTFRPWQIEGVGTMIDVSNSLINLKTYLGNSYGNTAYTNVICSGRTSVCGKLEYTTLDGRDKTIDITPGVNIIPDLFVRNDMDVFVKYTKLSESSLSIHIRRRRIYYV